MERSGVYVEKPSRATVAYGGRSGAICRLSGRELVVRARTGHSSGGVAPSREAAAVIPPLPNTGRVVARGGQLWDACLSPATGRGLDTASERLALCA